MSESLTVGTADVKRRYGVITHTVVNWITEGVSSRGRKVKLEAERVGGRWKTSEAALARFFDAVRNPVTAA